MYTISKEFTLCYGHSVFSQDVVAEYAGSDECPCQRLHGHQGTLTVQMKAEQLDARDFVIDFKELTFVKRFIDSVLDHRFLVSTLDPNFELIVGLSVEELTLNTVHLHGIPMGSVIDPEGARGHPNLERHFDSFVIVDFNPTSEEIARWFYEGLERVLADSPFDCTIDRTVWSETPKTTAVYTR